ncbi:hypothetical protein AVEN_92195-1 [Araneus ventricosus]|uniref:RNase H type-1 domain-containing protein n=1 Tax=Araneus ventricosus TaxID=182803 RepID=A0A4Y2ALY9_ARAVE|nr:hypothetical protein AVEN_92195-1 [Araneus ventricosus]
MLLDLSEDDIKSLINSDTTPIKEIQKFSCHTQVVERCVKLVTEASNKVCGHEDRDGYMRETLKSRSAMPNFSKKSDFKCVVDIKTSKKHSKPNNPTLWKIFVSSYKYNVNTTPNNWMVSWVVCRWNSSCNHLHVINDQTGSAFCVIANEAITKTWKAKLSPANTVFQAEMLALKAAIEWANKANEDVNIWSDSESSLQALNSFNIKSKITQEAQMTESGSAGLKHT